MEMSRQGGGPFCCWQGRRWWHLGIGRARRFESWFSRPIGNLDVKADEKIMLVASMSMLNFHVW